MAGYTTIYVALLDDGVETWRPVTATRLGDDLYHLADDAPEDERWEFPPGSTVLVEERQLAEGPTLVATRLAQ
jgi:hypothetical protein